jgi:signal transduction histidine kinase
VAADSERFQQILLNLITNAIKFTTTGGSIGLMCDSDVRMVRVRVKVTGVGVRLLDIDRVFEPFVQIDRHMTTTSLQGVGAPSIATPALRIDDSPFRPALAS